MADEKKKAGPRELSKRPPSRSANAPDHIRTGKHGVRTTAQTPQEVREEAHKAAISEEYEEGRSTGAGPNPYKLKSVRDGQSKKTVEKLRESLGDAPGVDDRRLASYLESSGESKAADAELAIPGETRTDSGQKIVLEPDRIAADEKAVLPNVRERHKKAIGDAEAVEARQIAAHEEATATAGKDDLAADKNPGAGAPEMAR